MRSLGILLVLLGVAMLIWRGISYTSEKKVVDLGSIEVKAKEKKSVNWPLYTGAIVLVAGVVIMATDKKKA